MLTVFPQGLNDWRLRQTQGDRNASLSQQTLTIEDVFYALSAIEAKIGRDGSDVPASMDYRLAAAETLLNSFGLSIADLITKAGAFPASLGPANSILWFDGTTVQWTTSPTLAALILSGGLTIGGAAKFSNEVWHKSLTDGKDRLYFSNGGQTYYKSANGLHFWLDDSDAELGRIEAAGLSLLGVVKKLNNVATAGYGVPAIVALDQYTNRTTSIGSTNLAGTTPTGLYRVSVYMEGKSFPSGTDQVFLTLTWKDNAANNVSENTATLTISASTAHISKEWFVRHTGAGSANISYATTQTGGSGDGYDLLVTAERLN